MRGLFSFFISVLLFQSISAQENLGNVLFWTAQDWTCDYLFVEVYNEDSTLVISGRLKEKHDDVSMPECGSENVLNFTGLASSNYFFVADCTKEACHVCNGEGSYWQSTVQDALNRKNERKNKGQIEGSYKTCHVCQGNGEAFQILWIDTFSVQNDKCRTILLK